MPSIINPNQLGLQENYSNMPVINPESPSALPNEDNIYDFSANLGHSKNQDNVVIRNYLD